MYQLPNHVNRRVDGSFHHTTIQWHTESENFLDRRGQFLASIFGSVLMTIQVD
jgi:hypothetical protein